jgi:hypothetical protein
MKTIRTKTGVLVIVAFAVIAFSGSFLLSKLPRRSEWERYRTVYPEKAIRANLKQVVLAGGVYLRSHSVDEVTYDELLKVGQLISKPIDPVLGEDYRTIRLSRSDTKVEVVTEDGRTITYEFGTFGTGGISSSLSLPGGGFGDIDPGPGGL